MTPILLTLLTTLSAYAAPTKETTQYYAKLPCSQLKTLIEAKRLKLATMAEWMAKHCPGDAEFTVPFCKATSSSLLEELMELNEAEQQYPRCAPGGQSSMDPRLEHAVGISTRIRVKEPRVEVASAL